MDPLSIAASTAGLVTIAAQLASSVAKLKAFCEDIKDAPGRVKVLVNQLSHLVMIMHQLEDGATTQVPPNPVLQNSLEICRSAVGDISQAITKLEVDMRRNRRAAIRAVLKRNQIKDMLTTLEQSKTSLHLAFSVYSDARIRHENDVRWMDIQKLAFKPVDNEGRCIEYMQTVHVDQEEPEENQTALKKWTGRGRNSDTSIIRVRVQLPYWLCQAAWDLSFERAAGRWTTSLQAVTIIPADHNVWVMCMTGDIAGVRSLLDSRQVPLHGEDTNGRTLFTKAAVANWRTDLAKSLLNYGAIPGGLVELHPAILIGRNDSDTALLQTLSNFPAHLQYVEEQCGLPSPDKWSHMLRLSSNAPLSWSKEELVDVLSTAKFGFSEPTFKLLDSRHINEKHCLVAGNAHTTLGLDYMKSDRFMDLISYWWPSTFNSPTFGLSLSYPREDLQMMLRSLLEQAAGAGAELSAVDLHGHSPLVRMLNGMLTWLGTRSSDIDKAIHYWVSALFDAGIDLCVYGASEQRLRERGFDRALQKNLGILSLVSGPQPSDWYLWRMDPGDIFAGMLWDMLEHPERAIPGAWAAWDDEQLELSYYETGATQTLMRKSGLKAKTLRRIRGAMKRNEQVNMPTFVDAKKFALFCRAVVENGEGWKTRNITDPFHEHHSLMLYWIDVLGLTRPLRVGRHRLYC